MVDDPRDGEVTRGGSAPWERPRTWENPGLEATRVDDLLERLGSTDDRRSRRRDGEGRTVAAGELIAALRTGDSRNDGPDEALADPEEPEAPGAPTDPASVTDGAETADLAATDPPMSAEALDHPTGPTGPTPSATDTTGPAADVGGSAGASRPHHRHPWLVAGRAAIAVVAVIVLAVVGTYWNILDRAGTSIQDRRVDALAPADTHIVKPTVGVTVATTPDSAGTAPGVAVAPGTNAAQAPPQVYDAENILLLGSDTRAGANASAGTDPSLNDVANSDTLMVAHLSADRQKITILSIPRDTLIDAPTCKTWDANTGKVTDQTEPVSPGDRWHINSAFSVGGPKCTVTAVQQLTGMQIDRVIGIDFTGFKAMVDALGGIRVDICKPIVDLELSTIAKSSGMQTVIGQQALDLVRARKVVGETGSDLARIHRQQIVLSAILRQVTSAGTLLNPSRLDSFLQAFTKNTFTDNVSLQSLVQLAGSLGNLDPAHVTFFTLPTIPSTAVDGALEVDRTKAPALYNALINDLPLPGQTPVKPKPTGTSAVRTTAATRTSTLFATPTTGSTSTTLKPGDVPAVNAGQQTCA